MNPGTTSGFNSLAGVSWVICIHIKKQNEYRKEYCKPKWLVKSCENIGYETVSSFV